MEFLLEKTTVISLAVIGGVFSLIASLCNTRASVSAETVKLLNKVSYVFMGISIVLFLIVGLSFSETS